MSRAAWHSGETFGVSARAAPATSAKLIATMVIAMNLMLANVPVPAAWSRPLSLSANPQIYLILRCERSEPRRTHSAAAASFEARKASASG